MYAAVEAKQGAAVQALCQAGPLAVNKADEWGLSPLHIAARAGDADIVTLLLLAQVRWSLFASVHVSLAMDFRMCVFRF